VGPEEFFPIYGASLSSNEENTFFSEGKAQSTQKKMVSI
jgi:hypothetical protein